MMKEPIKLQLPVIFGYKAKDRLLAESTCYITLEPQYFIKRAVFRMETPVDWDDLTKGYNEELINEKLCLSKQHIVQIGVGYSNDDGCYFVAIEKINKTISINVESADKGNELLNTLIEWWKS